MSLNNPFFFEVIPYAAKNLKKLKGYVTMLPHKVYPKLKEVQCKWYENNSNWKNIPFGAIIQKTKRETPKVQQKIQGTE